MTAHVARVAHSAAGSGSKRPQAALADEAHASPDDQSTTAEPADVTVMAALNRLSASVQRALLRIEENAARLDAPHGNRPTERAAQGGGRA